MLHDGAPWTFLPSFVDLRLGLPPWLSQLGCKSLRLNKSNTGERFQSRSAPNVCTLGFFFTTRTGGRVDSNAKSLTLIPFSAKICCRRVKVGTGDGDGEDTISVGTRSSSATGGVAGRCGGVKTGVWRVRERPRPRKRALVMSTSVIGMYATTSTALTCSGTLLAAPLILFIADDGGSQGLVVMTDSFAAREKMPIFTGDSTDEICV